ncbi:MAG: germination protein YpeB [Bacillota bacterium]|nr:germination protein YpeB [Bacillota bacterium]
MHITMRKKTFVLIVTYLTAAVLALGGYGIAQSVNGRAYRLTAEYGYSHAFSEVVQSVDKLDNALKRGMYATGSEVSAEVCADICGSCQAAEMTMAVLPFSTQELEHTAAFINIAEDYAEYLLKTTGENGFSDTERANMASLAEISESLKKSLRRLSSDINDGSVLMDAPEDAFADGGAKVMSEAMLKMESELGELPTIDYNGSFPETTKAEFDNPVSEKAAKKAAEEFFGIEAGDTEYKTDGGVFCFGFDGGTVTVDAGGNVLSMSSQRSVAGDMESSELEATAEKFLDEKGFEEMKMLSSSRHDSVLTAVFACGTGGVLCENDCVKVSVAADDGSIYAFDATEYYKHHTKRQLSAPGVSEAAAKAAIPGSLTVKGTELVLCADNSLERLCYAFDCVNGGGEAVRVFVDANTGKQFKIKV